MMKFVEMTGEKDKKDNYTASSRLAYSVSNSDYEAQIGCLSNQELEKQNPPNGASSDKLIDSLDNTGTNGTKKSRKNKDRRHKWDDAFVDDMTVRQNCRGSDNKSKEKTAAIMSFQNCTLQCADPGNGESYWVSFEEKSFSKGNGFKVYSGRMNGIGPKSGEKCVVKVFRRCQGTEDLCRYQVKKCQKAKAMSRAFNDVMYNKIKVRFTTLYWAQMDEVSTIKQLFFTGERKLTTKETVLFEDDLRVNEERPNKHRELTLFMDCQGKKKRCIAKDLEAFAHFTYHLSNGKLVMCGLDGVQDEDGFFLKTPTIHSRTREYGSGDSGLQGILEVFANHVCNDFCKDMMKPNEDMNNLAAEKVDSRLAGHCSTLPSAVQEQDVKTAQVVSNIHHPPSERQDSVISRGSYVSDHLMARRQESSLSQVTDSLSGYLEPSAPMEDCSEIMFEPTPPPYSSVNVANWLLYEQSQNSFINSTSFEQVPSVRADSFVNRMSIESGLGASVITQSESSSLRGTSMDLNANFTEEDIDTSGISTSCCFDDCDESVKTASVQCKRKRVRFSLSSDTNSSNLPSAGTTTVTSDCPTVASTTANGANSGNAQGHPDLRHHVSYIDSQDIQYNSYHLISHGYAVPVYVPVNTEHGPNCKRLLPDSPPSYIDSEMAKARWILHRESIPIMGSNVSHTDNGHPNITRAGSVQNPTVPGIHAKTTVLKKSKSQ